MLPRQSVASHWTVAGLVRVPILVILARQNDNGLPCLHGTVKYSDV